MIITNFKTYESATGLKAVQLAKVILLDNPRRIFGRNPSLAAATI